MDKKELITADEKQRETSKQVRRLRAVLFRLGAILISLLLLVLLELVLRLVIPSPPVSIEDPYVSFHRLSPLFIIDPTGTRFETAEERLTAFCPQSFTVEKIPQSLRIFCLGGSTVQGRPYSVETSFTTWLEINLRAARPEVHSEVINCGGISYASYRLVPIMRELLEYEPDLFIIYTGHNEFLEDRTYEHIKNKHRIIIRIHKTLLNLRIYSLAHHLLSQYLDRRTTAEHSPKTILDTDVQTKLDFTEGLKSYHRDPAWRKDIIEHFHHNLETMVSMSRTAKVPVILMNPVSNLKDCPPFKSEHRSDLSDAQIQRVMELRKQAGELGWSQAYEKLNLLEQAVSIDSQHAGLLFMLGKCNERIGRFSQAKEWFIKAKEEDICPLRILEPMHEIIHEVADRHEVPLVHVRRLVEQRTTDGIAGKEWLLDQVHPNLTCHRLIADALYEVMENKGMVQTPKDWRTQRNQLCEQHLASLDDAYHARGEARLKRLAEWSRGRIPKQ